MNPLEQFTEVSELAEFLQSQTPKQKEIKPAELRYAIYIRKSTEDNEKQVRSLEDQLSECKKLADDLQIVVLDENIISESESAKESGTRLKFNKLIGRIEAGELDGIIAWHPNRLTRNMLEAGKIIDLLDKSIIKDLKFPSHTFANDASGKMLLGIVFVMAKQYSEQLSVDINRGIGKATEAGHYVNSPKHGYIKDNNQFLRPDGENWAIIKATFQMRLMGETLQSISHYIQNSGYFARGKESRKVFSKMGINTLTTIFNDPIYAGVMQYGNYVINVTEIYDFMPMITPAEYQKLNKIDPETFVFKTRKNTRGKGEERVAEFLPRHVYCMHCQNLMQAGISKGKSKKYYYFRCMTEGCERHKKSTRAKVILDFVTDFLEKKPFASKDSFNSYRREIVRIQHEGLHELDQRILSAKRNLGLKAEDIAAIRVNLAKETDTETKEIQKAELKRLEQERLSVRTQLEELEAKKKRVKQAPMTFEEFVDIIENIPAKIKRVRAILAKHALIAPIYLNFFVSAKNVEKYTLNSPFDRLISDDLQDCGDVEN